MALHKSDSKVQSYAAEDVIEILKLDPRYIGIKSTTKDLEENKKWKKICFDSEDDKTYVEVDAVITTENNVTLTHVFEIYAKAGELNSGTRRKISEDILKLALLRDYYGKRIKAIIVLIDDETKTSYVGKTKPTWKLKAAETFGIEIIVVNITPDLITKIKEAQKKQNFYP